MLPERQLRLARWLSLALAVVAAAAAATGLFWPSIYRETAWVVPQNRGQDLVTILAALALVAVVVRARDGKACAVPVWIGIVGYLGYTAIGAAFAYRFNALFLVYVAWLSLAGASLIALLGRLDAAVMRARFGARAPRRATAVSLAGMAALLSVLWLSEVFRHLATGELPRLVVLAETPTNFVFVLDLGVVVPLSVLSAVLLWRDRPWGYVLAGAMLMKAACMGLALLAMTAFSASAGFAVDWEFAAVWLVVALGGIAMSAWYFATCGAADLENDAREPEATPR